MDELTGQLLHATLWGHTKWSQLTVPVNLKVCYQPHITSTYTISNKVTVENFVFFTQRLIFLPGTQKKHE